MKRLLIGLVLLSSTASFATEYYDLKVQSNADSGSNLFINAEIPSRIGFFDDGVSLEYAKGSHGFSKRHNFAGEILHEECNVKKLFYKSSTEDSEYILYIEDRRNMNTDLETDDLIKKNGCLDIYHDKKIVVVVTKSERGFSSKIQTLALKEK